MDSGLTEHGAADAWGLSDSRLTLSGELISAAHERIAECLGDWDPAEDIWELTERDLAADWTHIMALLRGSMYEYGRSSLAEES